MEKERFTFDEFRTKMANGVLEKENFLRFCFEIMPVEQGQLDIFYVIVMGLLWCLGDTEDKASALFNVLQPSSAFTEDLIFN